jgi:NTE family protein
MVATDLENGDKVVLASGDLIESLRATMSVPGLFAPCRIKGRWLIDGGLVDPVPVGLARAMGADVVIAVDLNCAMTSRKRLEGRATADAAIPAAAPTAFKNEMLKKMAAFYENAESSFKGTINDLFRREPEKPDIIETVMAAIHIVQDRITRINLAVDPPDVLLQPRLGELKMMDFDQVEHVIEEGYISAKEKIEDIRAALYA